jgi:predicted glycoside hydrolase/deacetylase ChbG (UPF0249 family)
MNLIINADDLGISRQVNDAVFDLLAARRISSATVMANAPELLHAAGNLRSFPECSFGAHLNLTQFEPLTSGPGAKLLSESGGPLSRNIAKASPTPKLLQAIYDELCAQVDRLISLDVPVSHFDSHHHVHTMPYVFPVLKALQRRYRVRRVRLSKNLYAPGEACPPALRWKKCAFNWAIRRIYQTQTTDRFTELLSFCRLGARSMAYRSVELMVHPGAPYSAEETAVLNSDWLECQAARLISYRDLAA